MGSAQATALTLVTSSGGKTARATWPRFVLQAIEPLLAEAFSPAPDGLARHPQLLADLGVGLPVRGHQHQLCSQHLAVGAGVAGGEVLELGAILLAEGDLIGAASRHGSWIRCAQRHSFKREGIYDREHLVSEIVERLGHPDLALAALHHDSHEAYACDIPSPLKHLLQPGYGELTDKLDAAITTALGLDHLTEGSVEAKRIKAADRAALKVEAGSLLRGEPPPVEVNRQALNCARQVYDEEHWPSDKAKEAFLRRAGELG